MPAQFEKDDDTNFHIDLIVATSNLQGENYATTTCLVAGPIGLELFLLDQGFMDVEKFQELIHQSHLAILRVLQPDRGS